MNDACTGIGVCLYMHKMLLQGPIGVGVSGELNDLGEDGEEVFSLYSF